MPRTTRPDQAFDSFLRLAREACLRVSRATECHVVKVEVTDLLARYDATGQYRADRQVIEIDRSAVADPVMRLLMNDISGLDLDDAVEGAATINHEHIHALGPSDPGPANGYGIIWRGLRARNSGPLNWEEGVTEAWSITSFSEFLTATGLAKLEPRLLKVPYPNSYEFEVLAVRQVAAVLGSLAARTDTEMLRVLAAELPDTRSSVVADLILAGQGLSMHPENLAMASDLERAIDGLFDFIDLTNSSAAAQAVARIHEAMDSLRDRYPSV